jgi:RimJ/RimL family protein N-acetyltransferase
LEIGWTWYAPEYWRTAVNTECKYLLLRHAFEVLECIRVQIRTDERNQRSRRAIERIGGVLEAVVRKDRIAKDGWQRSSAQYSLIAEEWPERKAWFEEQLRR